MLARANGNFNKTPCFEVDPQTCLAKSVAAFFKPFIDELDYLLSEDWWKRVWIVQEADVSPRVVFAYASERPPIPVWQRAYAWYKQHSAGCCRIHIPQMRHSLADTRLLNILAVCMERLDRVLSARAGFRSGEEVSLYRLRYNFNMQQATDGRDLIYGLLGLVNDWGSVAPITPDYSKATSPSVLACGVGDGGN